MSLRDIGVFERTACNHLREAMFIMVSSVSFRVVIPDPLSNLEEPGCCGGEILLDACNIEVMEFFSVDKSGLLQNADSLGPDEAVSLRDLPCSH